MLKLGNFKLRSKALQGNPLHDPVTRDVTTIECRVNERSPILIGLAGFYGSGDSFLNRSHTSSDFLSILNKIASRKSETSFIAALPDTITLLRGNQYVNSPAVGKYEDFLIDEVINELFAKYGERKVGLFGKSSGGFGSYSLTIRHPDVIDGFIDVSGDAAFEYCYLKDLPKAINILSKTSVPTFLRKFRRKPNPNSDDLLVNNVIAMSAFYSPNKKSELGYDLPFDPSTTILDSGVWEKWLKFDPARNVTNNLDKIKGKSVSLQTGNRDEFAINLGMKQVHLALDEAKIGHMYREYDAGHFGIDFMYEDSLPRLARDLA